MNFRLLEPAEQELDDAIDYYNRQVEGLGDTFLLEALRAFDLIVEYPRAWHRLGEGIRWCRLNRFPYAAVYIQQDDEILVVAMAHLHRNPGYWMDRIGR